MIQLLSVIPCSRALLGPNGYHIKGAAFVRNIYEPKATDIDFVVALRFKDEPPPEVNVELYDPWTNQVYVGTQHSELEVVSPILHVTVRVRGVILQETGEYAFKLLLNGEPFWGGPLWGYRK